MADDPPRWWTIEEANDALARVSALVESLRAAAGDAARGTASLREDARGNGHGRSSASSESVESVSADLASLRAEGIVLRDIEQGLVDFPARAPSGRPYWLCWVVGEPAVTWWHWPEDGFAGRRPLSEPPE